MQELFIIFSEKNMPFEIVSSIYMLQVCTNDNRLKKELIQLHKTFYDSKIRLFYIKKHQRMLMKYRIKQKLKYYKNKCILK